MIHGTKFKKRPIEIEARVFDGSWKGVQSIEEFVGGSCAPYPIGENYHIRIQTREGIMVAEPWDWIIKGIEGEFYPCKPSIFAATYELVEK